MAAADCCVDTGPEDFAHAPLCVQVVGMRQEDESLLGVATAIDDILHDRYTNRSKGH